MRGFSHVATGRLDWRRIVREGKHGIVAGVADGFNQRRGRRDGRIEDHLGAMGHQINVRGFDPGR
jgi:hypothetical protein